MRRRGTYPPSSVLVTFETLLARLKSQSDPQVAVSAARFGISTPDILGLTVPQLRAIASEIGHDHALAAKLWKHGALESRILAALVDEPGSVTEVQMEKWVSDFDSWAVCDACCGILFDKTPFAWRKAAEWSTRSGEYGKRAAFSLMAALAVHDKNAPDPKFAPFFPIIKRESVDDRNFVKKGVNWALRQIGKRNLQLNVKALRTAHEIRAMNTKSGNWIASDAIRELSSEAVQTKLSQVKRAPLQSL